MKRYLIPLASMFVTAVLLTGIFNYAHWVEQADAAVSTSDNTQESGFLPSVYSLLLNEEPPEAITALPAATPAVGNVPLTVTFTTDSTGPVTLYRWDFDNDGIWDWVGNSKETLTHVYLGTGTYIATLEVEDRYGNLDSAEVSVLAETDQKPSITFTADTYRITTGQSAVLDWLVSGADTISIDQGIGEVNESGTTTVIPDTTTLYTLSATGPLGESSDTLEIQVLDPAEGNYEVYLNTPSTGDIFAGDSITVTGISSQSDAQVWVNGQAATVSGFNFSTNIDLVPGYNSIEVTASWGSDTAGVTSWVTRSFVYTPQPEGSFGQGFEDLMPDDAVMAAYDEDRFTVLSGAVENSQGGAIAGVAVTILHHPEYGTADTDSSGNFSLPVDGGVPLTLVYTLAPYITVHRSLDVPANDIAVVDTIIMLVQDTKVSAVSFDGNPDTIVTHQSSVTTDASGSRTISTVFKGDNRAWEVDKYGRRIRELSNIETRSTEFTLPQAMPSVLPPNSAFTYCAELSVDGVEQIEFDQPVVTWVNNFLGFEVGEIVPAGYYDRISGAWIPAPNGVVVRLLDTNSDGITDAIDATGDGVADDLNGNNATDDEALGLSDPVAYAPGSTFWRVEVTHFTSWDFNWGVYPPDDSTAPNPNSSPHVDQRQNNREKNNFEKDLACSIDPIGRILQEDIPIPGTGISLHYASNRVSGYKTPITIPASGATIPPSLKAIKVKLEVAGQIFEQDLPAAINQSVEFVWNGRYQDGSIATNPVIARTSIGFVYDAQYARPDSSVLESFSQPGIEPTAVTSREQFIIWKHWATHIDASQRDPSRSSFGAGWTLSNHHEMRTLTGQPTLFKGDGTVLQDIVSSGIRAFAGTEYGEGYDAWNGIPPGMLASEVYIGTVDDIAYDSRGNTYVSSYTYASIYKIDPNGYISVFAGGGNIYLHLDGIPALQADIGEPTALAVDSQDNVYFYDSANYRIRKVDQNGILSTVMGSGSQGELCLNNCSKAEQTLSSVQGMTIDQAGNIYITNEVGTIGAYRRTIGKIDTNGIYNAIAGLCPVSYNSNSGCLVAGDTDGMPAKDVALRPAGGLAIGKDGSIYFTSTYDVVRKIDSSGILSTIAGTWFGPAAAMAARQPATDASLRKTSGIALDDAGNVYFTDTGRIQKVDSLGNISLVAGNLFGGTGSSGDGGPALLALIDPVSDTLAPYRGSLTIRGSQIIFAEKLKFRAIETVFPIVKNTADNSLFFVDRNGLGHNVSADGLHTNSIDLETGRVLRTYAYNNGTLESISDQFNNTTTIEYGSNDRPVSITSAYGLTTELSYDANGYLSRVRYPDNSYFDFTYSPDELLLSKVEPNGSTYTHTYDSLGRLASVSDDETGSWSLSNSGWLNGEVINTMTSASGTQTRYAEELSSSGDSIMNVIPASGGTSSISWADDDLWRLSELSSGMSHTVNYNIDPLYRNTVVESITSRSPAGLQLDISSTQAYADSDGDGYPDLFTGSITANGKTVTLEHNTLLARKSTTSAEGRTATLYYDPATLLPERYSIPGLDDVEYSFDNHGRISSISQANRSLLSNYNASGFLSSVISPEGREINFSLDAMGRMVGITYPDSTSTGISYDSNSNITAITTPTDTTHTFSYNGTGKLSGYTLPASGGNYTYTYNDERMLTAATFPSGEQLTFSYSNALMSSSQLGTDTVNVVYQAGNLIQSLDRGSESLHYSYDGQLLLSARSAGTLAETINISYNDDFMPIDISYAGSNQNLAYDNDGLLISSNTMSITRDAQNGFATQISDGILTRSISRDPFGDISSKASTVDSISVFDWTASRNREGKITGKTETVAGVSHAYSYSYDLLGRLSTVHRDDSLVESYQYDNNGNRLSDLSGQSYSYDVQDRLTQVGSSTYVVNQNGYLTSITTGADTRSYLYSARGELLQATLPDGTDIAYTYDPQGRRIAKSINGTITEKYLWASRGRLLAIYDNNDVLLSRFEYSNGRNPDSMKQGGNRYYLFYDQVGSLKAVSDISGALIKQIEYDSFGRIISDSNPTFSAALGFAGGLMDSDTGFLYFSFRDYHPETGRWTAKDPLLFSGGDTNLYAYVSNDPVNQIDPLGLSKTNINDDYSYSDAFKDTVLDSAGILGDTMLFIGGAVALVTSSGIVAPVAAAVVMVKGISDLTLKSMNVQDKWNGDEPQSSGDAMIEFTKAYAPEDSALQDAALIASNTINVISPGAIGSTASTVLKGVKAANTAGTQIGLINTIGERVSDFLFGD